MADVNAATNDGLVLTVQLPESRDEVEIRHFGFAVDFQHALAKQGAVKASVDVESAIQDGPRTVKFDELETAAVGEAARNVGVLPEAPTNWYLVGEIGLDWDHRVLHRRDFTDEAFQAATAEYEAQGYEMVGSAASVDNPPAVLFRKKKNSVTAIYRVAPTGYQPDGRRLIALQPSLASCAYRADDAADARCSLPVLVMALALLSASSAGSALSPVYRVDHVIDGDTIELRRPARPARADRHTGGVLRRRVRRHGCVRGDETAVAARYAGATAGRAGG